MEELSDAGSIPACSNKNNTLWGVIFVASIFREVYKIISADTERIMHFSICGFFFYVFLVYICELGLIIVLI